MTPGQLLRLGSRRVEQHLREAAYLRLGIDATRPLAIRAHPTERCNYRCGSCACWRLPEYPAEMTLSQWCSALAGVAELAGRCTVQFAGGEPLLFGPFLDLVDWCRDQGLAWGMITNGSALNERTVARLVAARPLNIDVSVDGASSAVHDASRGMPGSLLHIRRGLQRLRDRREAEGARFAIRVKTTVHRRNLHELPALVDWAREAGANSIDFSPVRPWTAEVRDDLWLRPEDEPRLAEVVARLRAARRAGAPIETEDQRLASWPQHFRGQTIAPPLSPCRVGLRDLHILSNGDVRMCWEYPVVGNLTRATAREIWRGETARAQRRAMVNCADFGSPKCASSCLSHRSLAQDWQRVRLWQPIRELPVAPR
ncbi:radical SAM protein [Ideonella sp. YS5]|uniref:radical SAM protein n=1 Tax=Ideonella sp. YS5 TaxID=3453714 RepID=UPI003EEFF2FF